VVLAKPRRRTASSLPVSGFVARRELMHVLHACDTHGSTFGGPCAFAVAVGLESAWVIARDGGAGAQPGDGRQCLSGLRAIRSPCVMTAVRGRGLWAGELKSNPRFGKGGSMEALLEMGCCPRKTHQNCCSSGAAAGSPARTWIYCLDRIAEVIGDLGAERENGRRWWPMRPADKEIALNDGKILRDFR